MGGKLQGLLGTLSGAVSSACASGSSEVQVLAPLSRYTAVVHHILKLLGEAKRRVVMCYFGDGAASEGDLREKYYAAKRAEFAHAERDGGGDTGSSSRLQISLIDDFRGKPVTK